MAKRLLVVDDDDEIRELLEFDLSHSGYSVDTACDGMDGLNKAVTNSYDLVLLDVMMPKMNGFDVCKNLRKAKPDIPVLLLTAKGTITDKTQGFDCGADDYMVKPFLPKELTFRIMAILRRSYKNDAPLVILAESEIDFDRAEVRKAGDVLPLTAKEYEILRSLYRNAGKIVTIDTLCEAAWGDNPYGYENSLMAHIRRIREKIEADPSHPVSLVTIKGLGYKLILEE